MSIAVVFDMAGTLLHAIRVAYNISTDTLLTDVETTLITYDNPDRVLCVLPLPPDQLLNAPSTMLFSIFLDTYSVPVDISCSRRTLTKADVAPVIYKDKQATVGHASSCVRAIQERSDEGAILTLNCGCIVNMDLRCVEFIVATGGVPFVGVKETITKLMQRGVSVYIASGDLEEKVLMVANLVGIPKHHVCAVATPAMKAKFIRTLQKQYDTVTMVGDGINDLMALKQANFAILTEQQGECTIDALLDAADVRIDNICEVVDYVNA
jgi:Cu+-exporting ATPase